MGNNLEFDCVVCGTRHEPCIDMAAELRYLRAERAARMNYPNNRLNLNGIVLSDFIIEGCIDVLNQHGSVVIYNTPGMDGERVFATERDLRDFVDEVKRTGNIPPAAGPPQ